MTIVQSTLGRFQSSPTLKTLSKSEKYAQVGTLFEVMRLESYNLEELLEALKLLVSSSANFLGPDSLTLISGSVTSGDISSVQNMVDSTSLELSGTPSEVSFTFTLLETAASLVITLNSPDTKISLWNYQTSSKVELQTSPGNFSGQVFLEIQDSQPFLSGGELKVFLQSSSSQSISFVGLRQKSLLRGEVGPQGEAGPLGPSGWNQWKGLYSGLLDYVLYDCVEFLGSTYIATQASGISSQVVVPGQTPGWESYWDLVAERGAQGLPGPKGAPGEPGLPGELAQKLQDIGDVSSTDTPAKNDLIIYDGSEFRVVPPGTSFSFSIASWEASGFTSGLVLCGIGDYTSPGDIIFSASYNNGPATEAYISGVGWTNLALAGTTGPTPSEASISYLIRTTYTLTLFASKSISESVSSSTSVTFANYLYYGVLAKASNFTEADVKNLTPLLTNDLKRTLNLIANFGEYLIVAYPAAFSDLTYVVGGFEGGFTQDTSTLSVGNSKGFSEAYKVDVSVQSGLGLVSLEIS